VCSIYLPFNKTFNIQQGDTMLTYEQVLFMRATKNTIGTLLLPHILDHPAQASEVARLLGVSHRTAREQLQSLEQLGLVIRLSCRSGYTLTDYARQLQIFDVPKLKAKFGIPPSSPAAE
jgi:DNA-binding MarR family transcriptional regulator